MSDGERGMGRSWRRWPHVVSRSFKNIYIPSTHVYEDVIPWGSHPDLDPNWSSDQIELIHDGCERNKFNKYELIVQDQVALKTLRVCWENRDGAYNCGKCGKCIRAMITLKVWGIQEHPGSFSSPLSSEACQTDKNAP